MKEHALSVNGVSLHVIEAGEGRPVLFCHGFPDTWRGWRRQVDAVTSAGYRAIVPDMRGYGRSSAPQDPSLYTPLHTVGDLIGVLDAFGISSTVVVGHDWGADVAWNAAMMRPDRFHAVAGISVPYVPRGDQSILQAMHAIGHDDFYMFGQMRESADEDWANAADTIPGILYTASASLPPEQRWKPFDYSSLFQKKPAASLPPWADPDDVAYAIKEYQRTGFHAALNYYRAIPMSFDLLAPFKGAKVHQPSLFLLGKEDGLYPFFHQPVEVLRENMPGLRTYLEVDDAGHWLMQEKPDIVNVALLKFLREL